MALLLFQPIVDERLETLYPQKSKGNDSVQPRVLSLCSIAVAVPLIIVPNYNLLTV